MFQLVKEYFFFLFGNWFYIWLGFYLLEKIFYMLSEEKEDYLVYIFWKVE